MIFELCIESFRLTKLSNIHPQEHVIFHLGIRFVVKDGGGGLAGHLRHPLRHSLLPLPLPFSLLRRLDIMFKKRERVSTCISMSLVTDRQTDRQMRKLNIPDLHLHELGDKRRQIDRQTGKLHIPDMHLHELGDKRRQIVRQTGKLHIPDMHLHELGDRHSQIDSQTGELHIPDMHL